MTFCLESIVIKPEEGVEIKNAIILLHGYGGDAKDISMLTLNWKRHMPNTVFICPNGHEPCAINPSGFQWFDLTKDDTNYIVDQSIKAEDKIKLFINEIKREFNLDNNQISNLEIPTGNPLIIELDKKLEIIKCEYLDKERAKNLLVF